ncbi:unnamed protein product, partial [Polarella glacialis]
ISSQAGLRGATPSTPLCHRRPRLPQPRCCGRTLPLPKEPSQRLPTQSQGSRAAGSSRRAACTSGVCIVKAGLIDTAAQAHSCEWFAWPRNPTEEPTSMPIKSPSYRQLLAEGIPKGQQSGNAMSSVKSKSSDSAQNTSVYGAYGVLVFSRPVQGMTFPSPVHHFPLVRSTLAPGPCGGAPEGSVSSLRVRCPVPWSAPWVGGGWLPRVIPRFQLFQVRGSVKLRLHLDLPSGGAQLRVTFRVKTSRPPPRTRVALCLQPRWDHAAVVGRWPNLLEDWLRFHLQVIQGIGRIYMYDVDGSLGGESARWPAGVHYEEALPGRIYGPGLRNLSRSSRCRYCAENIAYDHCLMSSRGLADYVLVLHGIDEWLATAPGSTLNLADHLDSLGSAGAVAFLESHFLYHLDRNVSGDLVQSGIYRPLEPRQADSRPYDLAPHLVFRPAGATYVDTHYLMLQPRQAVQRRETGTWIRLTEWWVNHYADFMGPLKRTRAQLPKDPTKLDLECDWHGLTTDVS